MKTTAMILALVVAAMATGCTRTGDDAPKPATGATPAPAADAREPREAREAGARDAAPPARPAPTIAVGEPHPSAPAPAGEARLDGYGPLRFGMTADEARKAWTGGLQGDEIRADNCAWLHAAGTAAGPFLMFEQGRFVRYDLRGANATAPGGGRVGMTAEEIRRLYDGRVTESPHHYVEGGRYLRIADPASTTRALLFEVDAAGRVTQWRVGQAPQVDYVEGCG